MARTYEGGCHCGRVRFRVSSDLSRVVVCNCSICTKKGLHFTFLAPKGFQLRAGLRYCRLLHRQQCLGPAARGAPVHLAVVSAVKRRPGLAPQGVMVWPGWSCRAQG